MNEPVCDGWMKRLRQGLGENARVKNRWTEGGGDKKEEVKAGDKRTGNTEEEVPAH